MIRSRRIPQVLDRICDDNEDEDNKNILSAVLVTLDGELLGTSSNCHSLQPDVASFGTLVSDMYMDYVRLGASCVEKSQLQCFMVELEQNVLAVAQCGEQCLVIVVAAPHVPLGLVKAKLEATAAFVQEALSSID